MGVVFMCINSSIKCVVAKMSHSIHAIAWQLIVNELLVDAKALIMLGFLKKTTHIYTYSRILQVQTCICYAYMHTYEHGWACATGGCMRSMHGEIHRWGKLTVNHKGN